MFSGLTNQFTSLVGAVKGGQADEDVPAPPQEAAEGSVAAAVEETNAAAGGEQPVEGEEGSKSWLGSAKGWLGSASIPSMPAMPTMAMPSMPAMPAMPSIPSIPGLRKSGTDVAGDAAADGSAEQVDAMGGAVSGGDDDDKSRYISATEGADSHPASGGGTPTGDEGQIGQVTTKVTQQAKHFGSFLSSAINKAGAKIKETVKDNTILESFNKEQDAFIKSQGGADNGVAPWIGHTNEAKIKEEILGLSQDRRNFVRAPPAGVDFDFSYDVSYPTAIAIMAEDKALETMRFELVPKIITEENFWRNYFYRVSLIIQAAELGTLGADGVGQASSGEDVKSPNLKSCDNKSKGVEINEANKIDDANSKSDNSTEIVQRNVDETQTKTAATELISIRNVIEDNTVNPGKQQKEDKQQKKQQKLSESEFVSETFQTSTDTDLEEIKDGMRKLGIDSMTQQALATNDDEEQWEKDLEAELKDYEVVSDSGGATHNGGAVTGIGDDDDELPTISNLRTRSTNNDWEEYADLIEDTDDLK